MIWKQKFNPEDLNNINPGTMVEHLGIEVTNIRNDYITARMPVDHRTVQPYRILHGGASCVLAETLGSVASVMSIEDLDQYTGVGVEINANHLRPVTKGFVFGTVTPVRIGRSMHVWNIEIKNEAGKLICVSRITIAVVKRFHENPS